MSAKKRSRVYRPRDPEVNSAVMASIRSKDNLAEVALRKELWRRGFRYRLYARNLPGRPDIVFSGARTTVFVDGDFWHGRILLEKGEAALRETFRKNRTWWVKKIRRNVERDRDSEAALEQLGWRVVRLWEKDILRDVSRAADRVGRIVSRRYR